MIASPTKNPDMKPPSTTSEIILLNASITKTKRSGDRGSSCLNPHELLNKPFGVPFPNIEKKGVEIQ